MVPVHGVTKNPKTKNIFSLFPLKLYAINATDVGNHVRNTRQEHALLDHVSMNFSLPHMVEFAGLIWIHGIGPLFTHC